MTGSGKHVKRMLRRRAQGDPAQQTAPYGEPVSDEQGAFEGTPEAVAIEEQKRRETEDWEDANDVGGHYPGNNPAQEDQQYERRAAAEDYINPMLSLVGTCPGCSGEGDCTSCEGSGLNDHTVGPGASPEKYREAQKPCGMCDGSGNCASCKGSGQALVVPASEVTKLIDRLRKGAAAGFSGWGAIKSCPDCRGDGVCAACYKASTAGTDTCGYCGGTKVCPSCAGSGYVRIAPAEAPKKSARQIIARVYATQAQAIGARVLVRSRNPDVTLSGRVSSIAAGKILVSWDDGKRTVEKLSEYEFLAP